MLHFKTLPLKLHSHSGVRERPGRSTLRLESPTMKEERRAGSSPRSPPIHMTFSLSNYLRGPTPKLILEHLSNHGKIDPPFFNQSLNCVYVHVPLLSYFI